MRTYWLSQGTLPSALRWPKWEGILKNKEGLYVYIYIADSFCCVAETSTTLYSDYIPVKITLNKKQSNNFLTNEN